MDSTIDSSSSDEVNDINKASLTILASDSQDANSSCDETPLPYFDDSITVISESNDEFIDQQVPTVDLTKQTPQNSKKFGGNGWRSVASTVRKKMVMVNLCDTSSDEENIPPPSTTRKVRRKIKLSEEKNTTCNFKPPSLTSSSSDDEVFEKFLSTYKTPKQKSPDRSSNGMHDESFIAFSSDEENDGPSFHLGLKDDVFEQTRKPTETFKTPKHKLNYDVIKPLTEPKNHKYKDPNVNSMIKKSTNSSRECKASFLSSLTTDTNLDQCDPNTLRYRKDFKKTKDELAQKLFLLFNKNIFNSQLPSDMSISWNPRMTSTAGFCYNLKGHGLGKRNARIELAPKVVDNPERLRDTLIHELCHAATWVIDGLKDGHGPVWKNWTRKAVRMFPDLPPITTSHTYKIHTKYIYRCIECSYRIGRHSKSVDTERKRCPLCLSKLQLFNNSNNKLAEPKTPSKFAVFVKENYSKVKSGNNLKHGDIMRLLSADFAKKVSIEKN